MAGANQHDGDETREVAVRKLEPSEAKAVIDLWRLAETTPSITDSADEIKRALTYEYAQCLVAEIENRIVGTVIATYDGWRGNIYRLAVHPEYRRRHIGLQLLQHADQAFRQWGVRRITALVERDREWATAFWSAAGYLLDPKMARFVRNLNEVQGH